MVVTDALRRLLDGGGGEVAVTVVAETPGEESNDVLAFSRIRLLTYK